jgi:uracil-DNA glycosylase
MLIENCKRKEVMLSLCCGALNKKKEAKSIEKHLVLNQDIHHHNQGKWFGNKHFSKANAYLASKK